MFIDHSSFLKSKEAIEWMDWKLEGDSSSSSNWKENSFSIEIINDVIISESTPKNESGEWIILEDSLGMLETWAIKSW